MNLHGCMAMHGCINMSQSLHCHCSGLSYSPTMTISITIVVTIAFVTIPLSTVQDSPTMTILPGHGPVLSSEAGQALAVNYLDTTSGCCPKVKSRWPGWWKVWVWVIFSTGQWPAWLALLCGSNIGEEIKWHQNVIKMVRYENIYIDKWHQNSEGGKE